MVPITPIDDFNWLSKYPLLEQESLYDFEQMAGPAAAIKALEQCLQDLKFRLDTILAATEEGDSTVLAREIRVIHSLADTFGMRRLSEITRLTTNALQLGSAKNLSILTNELVAIAKLSIGVMEEISDQKSRQLGT